MDNTHIKTDVICVHCRQVQTIMLSKTGIEAYQKGALMQDAFPELTAGQREMLISGTCDNCWKKFFGESE